MRERHGDNKEPAGDGSGLTDIARGTPLTYIVLTFPAILCQNTSRGRLPIRTLARHKLKFEDSGSAPMGMEMSTRSTGENPLRGIFIIVCVVSTKLSASASNIYDEAPLPLTFSFSTLDRDWVPASYSIALISSHLCDWRPLGGDWVRAVSSLKEPLVTCLSPICYKSKWRLWENQKKDLELK
jgi:hypothetical protein